MNLWARLNQIITGRNRIIWFEYGLLSLAVLMPLLKPGYVLTLDMIFTPELPLPTETGNTYVFQSILHYLNYVLPSQVIQKIILFLILTMSGVGMHNLIQGIGDRLKTKAFNKNPKSKILHSIPWGAYFAGIFYMVNPYTYTRFMVGHYLLLLGYAMLPFFVARLLDFLASPARRTALKLTVWGLAISVVSIHMVGFMVLISLVAVTAAIIKFRRNRLQLWKLTRYGLAAAAIAVMASSYWFVPYITGQSSSGQLAGQFDRRHTEFFKTIGDKNIGLPLNAAALYGFWGDEKGSYYVLPKKHAPLWPVVLVFLLALMAIGIRTSWRHDRFVTITIAGSGLIALIFSLGIAYGPVAPLNNWLSEHVPLFAGYREPQKFVALVALAEAYFCGVGLSKIMLFLENKKNKFSSFQIQSIGIVILFLPLLYTPTMLWGFSRQLKAVDYPADWYALNQRLKRDEDNFKVLFLPWHQYMRFNFVGRTIANPADSFFDSPVIRGDNAEFGQVYREVSNPVGEDIENSVLRPSDSVKDAGARLQRHSVKYIVLAKEVDWQDYEFLNRQEDIKLVSETDNLKVYENLVYRADNL